MTSEGTNFGSRYIIGPNIGKGAVGLVHRAHDTVRDTEVAIKFIRSDLLRDDRTIAKFLQERSILQALEHPNIVRFHDLVIEGGNLGLVMQLIDGKDLRHRLNIRTFPEREAASLMAPVFGALAYAHREGVLHRDIKPENILVESPHEAPKPYVTDFGIGRILEAARSSSSGTAAAGTAAYIAPERMTRPADADHRGDLYSAGHVLMECVTGEAPFAGLEPAAAYVAHMQQEPARPPEVSDEFWAIAQRLMAKDPDQRPSAEEAAAYLGSLANGKQPKPLATAAIATPHVKTGKAPVVPETIDPVAEVTGGSNHAAQAPTREIPVPAVPAGSDRATRRRALVGLLAGAALLIGGVASAALLRSEEPGVSVVGSGPEAAVSLPQTTDDDASEAPGPSATTPATDETPATDGTPASTPSPDPSSSALVTDQPTTEASETTEATQADQSTAPQPAPSTARPPAPSSSPTPTPTPTPSPTPTPAPSPTPPPAGAPSAPTNVMTRAGNEEVTVGWDSSTANGDPVKEYRVTSNPENRTVTTASLTATFTGLTKGGTYSFAVVAISEGGRTSSTANSSGVTVKGPPDAPNNVTATAQGSDSARVTWSPADTYGVNVDEYIVRTSSGFTREVDGDDTSVTITGLEGGSTYSFEVVATSFYGDSPPGYSNSTTLDDPIAEPGAPSLSASASGPGSVALSWSPPSDDGGDSDLSYEYQVNGGSTTSAGSGSSKTVTGLSNGTSYTFRLRAKNSGGSGPWSNEVSVTTWNVPSKVGQPGVTAGDKKLTFTWSAPASNGSSITKYEVDRKGSSSVNNGTSRTYVWSGLTNGSTYEVRVRACNAVGCGTWSSYRAGTPKSPKTVSASKGASAQGRPGCSSSACRYLNISASGFSANTSYTVKCQYNNGGGWADFYSTTRTTNGSGALTYNDCYYGFPGNKVRGVVGGVGSNQITW